MRAGCSLSHGAEAAASDHGAHAHALPLPAAAGLAYGSPCDPPCCQRTSEACPHMGPKPRRPMLMAPTPSHCCAGLSSTPSMPIMSESCGTQARQGRHKARGQTRALTRGEKIRVWHVRVLGRQARRGRHNMGGTSGSEKKGPHSLTGCDGCQSCPSPGRAGNAYQGRNVVIR